MADEGSIVTLKWDNTADTLKVIKIEAPTVHVVTTPDHQPLQLGGGVAAKSLAFISLNATQVAAVAHNSFYLDTSNVLKWKDNSGISHTVTLT